MADNVYLNADRTQVVPAHAAGKKWQVTRREAVALGLLDSTDKPLQERRPAFDASAAVTPTDQPKQKRRKRK